MGLEIFVFMPVALAFSSSFLVRSSFSTVHFLCGIGAGVILPGAG